jgi:ribosomal protein S18 acetylase RimI-like enzyme
VIESAGSVQIRRADLHDLQDAVHFRHLLDSYARDPLGLGAALAPHLLEKTCADLAACAGARIYLAGLTREPCGFATCFLGYSTFRARPLLNIHDLAVLPARRRLGVGRALLEAIADDARRLGCCKLTLEVREDNPAVRLYRGAGFQAASTPIGPVQYLFLEKPL